MNLLYIVSLYPCWSETFIVREMKSLQEQGVNINVLSLRGDKEEFVQKNDIESVNSVIYTKGLFFQLLAFIKYFILHPVLITSLLVKNTISFWSAPLTLVKNISTILRTLSVINQLDGVDHIHAHWATYPSTAALLISKITGKTFSFTSHAHDIFLENHFIKDKVNASKFSVTISNFNVKLLGKIKGINAKKIKVIHCAIDPNSYKVENLKKEFNILAVGRFDEIKGFKYLIDAISELHKNNVEITCNIIGSGELKEALVEQTKKHSLEKYIVFHGAKQQHEVRDMMLKSEMFVLPSIKTDKGNMDGIPVVLMESMALGTPVISTRVSGIPELINDKVNGYLIDEKNTTQLTEVINTLINLDDATRENVISNARKTIETDFNINIEANKLLEYIRN